MSTGIEWTDRVWNPVTGCTKVSAGCKNCYAEGVANRFFASQYPDVEVESNGPAGCYTRSRQFTDVMTHDDRLTQPLSWEIRRTGGFQCEDDVLRWLIYKGADQLDIVVPGDCLDLPYSRAHRRLLEKERRPA